VEDECDFSHWAGNGGGGVTLESGCQIQIPVGTPIKFEYYQHWSSQSQRDLDT
jgi:hypothetical protein